MQASKVTISPNIVSNPLASYQRRNELRTEAILAVLRKTPAGTPLATKQLIVPANMNYWTGLDFLKRMVASGIISMERVPQKHKYYFTILKDSATTTKTASKLTALLPSDVADKARDWAWVHNSNDLRDFIKHLTGDNR